MGSKYKWSSIKNTINYEQERDRAEIYRANLRSESAKAQLRPDHEPYPADRAIAQPDASKQQPLLQQFQDSGAIPSGSSKQSRKHIQRIRESERPNKSHYNQVYEKPNSISLVSLLDSHRRGDNIQLNYESDMVVNELMREGRKRKKRKRLKM